MKHIYEKKVIILPLLIMGVLMNFALTNCTISDSDEVDTIITDSLIIGEWELKTLLPLGGDCDPGVVQEIPSGQRDIFIFSSKGKVKVIKKKIFWIENWPSEDGEYDYSYDKEKQTIQLCGKTWRCTITDGKMLIEPPLREQRQYFIFIKKTDLENPTADLPGGEIIGENTFLGKWELMRLELVAPVDTVFLRPGQHVLEFRDNGDYQISTTDIGSGVGRYSLDRNHLTLYEPPILSKEVYNYKFNEDRTEVSLTSTGASTLVPSPVQVFRKIE